MYIVILPVSVVALRPRSAAPAHIARSITDRQEFLVANRPFAMWTLRQSKAIQNMQFGIRANLGQFTQQLVQVLLVGLTIGMMRNVVPALAESEFGVPRESFMLLVAFVVAFGFVKGTMNFVAGRMAERLGRKQVLLLGWLVALPIPPLVYFAGSWSWIVLATILLGVNQGLTWSMTQTAKLDITVSTR